jgi:hypothetical protein
MRKRKTPHFFVKSIDPTPPRHPWRFGGLQKGAKTFEIIVLIVYIGNIFINGQSIYLK